jgi:hypothetical protein
MDRQKKDMPPEQLARREIVARIANHILDAGETLGDEQFVTDVIEREPVTADQARELVAAARERIRRATLMAALDGKRLTMTRSADDGKTALVGDGTSDEVAVTSRPRPAGDS